MINLPNIEIISINCVNPEQAIKALLYSTKEIKFGAIKLFSHYKPTNLPSNIEYIQVPKLSYDGCSWFSLEELFKYVTHDYVLSIHDDGFIINPHLWDEKFLNYDYIGAPWDPSCGFLYDFERPGNRVGNGGFCLKSSKLLKLCSKISYKGGADDVIITNDCYNYFIDNGCKFAPVEIAMKFSLEMPIPECEYDLNNTFGFHGKRTYLYNKDKGDQFKQKIKLLDQI